MFRKDFLKKLNEIVYDLVTHVFNKHKLDVDIIKIDGFDLDRVYINNDEYILRMWNISKEGEVEYTLYKTINNGALRLGAGKARSSKRLVQLLQEDAERAYIEYEKSFYNNTD